MNRRFLISTAPAALLAGLGLVRCSTTGATTDTQVLADASGIVNSLLSEVPLLTAAAPTVITPALAAQVTGYLTTAKTTLAAVSAATPATTGATTLATVEGLVNQALAALTVITPAAASAYPPLQAALPILAAVNALLPVIEAFVNANVPAAAAVHRAGAAAPTMSPAVARAVLGIPVVK